MKTERLTLEKLASCMAAPIPTIPEHVLQVNRAKSYWVVKLCFQLDPVVGDSEQWLPYSALGTCRSLLANRLLTHFRQLADSISWCNFARHGH